MTYVYHQYQDKVLVYYNFYIIYKYMSSVYVYDCQLIKSIVYKVMDEKLMVCMGCIQPVVLGVYTLRLLRNVNVDCYIN